MLYKYRKVNPWIPYEVHASPHDSPGYDEPLFPVADTPIGRLGCAICYDWLFPEAMRQLAANGAEVLIRVSAYMDPWGATEPMDWWTVINRAARHREHRLRRRGQPGREPAPLPAVLVAGRQPDRRLRRAAARRSVARARRAHRRRADRHVARCATNARRGAGTTCWRTCAPRRTRSTAAHATRRLDASTPDGATPTLSYEGNNARIDAAKRGLDVTAAPTRGRTRPDSDVRPDVLEPGVALVPGNVMTHTTPGRGIPGAASLLGRIFPILPRRALPPGRRAPGLVQAITFPGDWRRGSAAANHCRPPELPDDAPSVVGDEWRGRSPEPSSGSTREGVSNSSEDRGRRGGS